MSQIQQQRVTGWAGWIVFGSVMMALSGALHILYGLGGIFSYTWYLYSSGTTYVIDATAWGWTMLIGGILLVISAFLLARGNMFGRVIGGLLAILSIVANIGTISVTPVWSIIAIVLDVLVLYAIVAHGGELRRLDSEYRA